MEVGVRLTDLKIQVVGNTNDKEHHGDLANNEDPADIGSSRDDKKGSIPQFPIQSPTHKGMTMVNSGSPPISDRQPMLKFNKQAQGKNDEKSAADQGVIWPGLNE